MCGHPLITATDGSRGGRGHSAKGDLPINILREMLQQGNQEEPGEEGDRLSKGLC